MKSIKCPHCRKDILAVTMAHNHPKAIKEILNLAVKPKTIDILAMVYKDHAEISYSSARRAIERLAQDGYLKRVSPGIYQAT